MRFITSLLFAALVAIPSVAQETVPVNDVRDVRTGAYAFLNATIHVDHESTVENGVLLIRDGKVEAVNSGSEVPDSYVTVDVSDKHIYPSLIDMYSTYGVPEVKREPGQSYQPEQITSKTEGAYNANQAIKAEYNASSEFSIDDKEAGALRSLGFGSVNTFRAEGLARGTSAFVTLSDESENLSMLESTAAAHYSFDKGTSRQSYPSSLMGYIALLRQTHLDAAWYGRANPKPFVDKSLDAWIAAANLPQIFDTSDWLGALRADRLGDEFDVQYIIKSGGTEYQRIDAVKETGAALIVPVTFPDAYDVTDPIDAYRVSYRNMKHWELAPGNLAAIHNAGIEFALTADGLKDKKKFWPNLRTAIERGLPESAALKALTQTPAELLGLDDRVGSLNPATEANFLITSGNLFDEETTIHENWIQGKRFTLSEIDSRDFTGRYDLNADGASYDVEITGEPGKHKAKVHVDDSTTTDVHLEITDVSVAVAFDPIAGDDDDRRMRLSGWITETGFAGSGQSTDGDWIAWSATRRSDTETDETDSDDAPETSEDTSDDSTSEESFGPVTFPFAAYGHTDIPEATDILIRNATVWSMEDDTRILENTDVLIRDGKIAGVGNDLSSRGAVVIDGSGKHVTPGIIDEHSHIATSSVNDVATNSGMVRIGDVIDSEDLGIYRALAGGVTAIQILHGSANPIGGQSALIKLRWGSLPEDMKIKDADGFIKFALGENVKRSWNPASIRYPQTRMGVEQVYVDAFTAARDYERAWNDYNNLSDSRRSSAVEPRRDLVMDTMLEILNSERFITCHSYVQSEINMLMKVAEQFDFRINTFTHILEGYKVADKMAEHGAGASTFADWWAYKWEVRYAIPYNATIMSREGVVTAINSDSGEMIRRLNQEAAKSVKYGDLSEYDAMKLVTINPAKLLHLDDRMGSILDGKDGDVVIWSDNPLSIYATVEKTIVDGVVLYDHERDARMKDEISKERARLVEKMRAAKSNGKPTKKPTPEFRRTWQCEDVVVHNANHGE